MTKSYILFTVLIICVSASTTDNKAGEKKPSTIRTSAGTELTTAPPTAFDISNFEWWLPKWLDFSVRSQSVLQMGFLITYFLYMFSYFLSLPLHCYRFVQ